MEHWDELYKDWLGAFASIGTPAISRDTAARILAVVYLHGNNEAFVYNRKFLSEIDHIKQMYHVDGGESPDAELVVLIRKYTRELEDYYQQNKDRQTDSGAVFHSPAPEWARKLFMERYGIKIIN